LIELRFYVPLDIRLVDCDLTAILTQIRSYRARTRHKIDHFRDVLPSQSPGIVLTKLNLTQQKKTTQEQNNLNQTRKTHEMLNLNEGTETKHKPKPTLIFKNCSYVRAYHCAHLSYTTQHRTVLIIFLLSSRQSS